MRQRLKGLLGGASLRARLLGAFLVSFACFLAALGYTLIELNRLGQGDDAAGLTRQRN